MSPEPASAGSSWKVVLRTFASLIGKDGAWFSILAVCLFLVYLYNLVPPLLLGLIVDFFVRYTPGASLKTFYWYAGLLGFLHVVVSLIRLWIKERLAEYGIILKRRARAFSFDRLLHHPAAWQLEEGTGNKVERINAGSDALAALLDLMANNVFDVVSAFVGVLVIFLFLDPVFTPFLAVYTAAYSFVQFFFNRRIIQLKRQINEAQQAVSGIYVEGISNAMTIEAMGAESSLVTEIQQYETRSKELELRKNILGTRKWYFFQFLNGLFLGSFLLLVGHGVIAGVITVGAILTYYTYFSKVRDATEDGNKLIDKLINNKVDVENMIPLWGEKFFLGDRSFPQKWDALRIKGGSLTYASGQRAMNDVTVEVRRGEVTAIMGPSGSGKSSFLKVLLGLYELTSGQYLVGSTPAERIKHEQLVANFSVVPQETELFHFSVRENITLMRDDRPEDLHRAIELARLGEVIQKLPQGLDTLIGEHGYRLSGGERQRIGIARAIYKDAPIIILDEATNALDKTTEKAVMHDLLAKYRHEKTFIIVAHRLSAITGADRLLTIRDGKVFEKRKSSARSS